MDFFFFLSVWIIQQCFIMAIGRGRQQHGLTSAGEGVRAGCSNVQCCIHGHLSATGGCFVSFHLAKAQTTQKSIEKLISKVLYKAKEILTRKKGNHTGNEIRVLASVFVHKGSVRYLFMSARIWNYLFPICLRVTVWYNSRAVLLFRGIIFVQFNQISP